VPADTPVDDVDANSRGLRQIYDWIEKDVGKTVLATAIQNVAFKGWEWVYRAFAAATRRT
jgi:hypothetical protein